MRKNSIYRSIAIPLNEKFGYAHSTHNEKHKEQLAHLYVGRERIIEKLVSLLKSDTRERGSYLITGYRGVGKTSVVNKALDRYRTYDTKDKKFCIGIHKQPLVIRINLGDNSQLTPLNVYFSIANILREEICNIKKPPFTLTPTISLRHIVFILSILFSITLGTIALGVSEIGWESILESILFSFANPDGRVLFLLSIWILLTPFAWWYSFQRWPQFLILPKVDELIERMSNEIGETQNAGLSYPDYFRFGWSKQKTRLSMNAREAEDQLSRILNELSEKGFKVIFILDEIDKLSDHEEMSEIHYSHTHVEDNGKVNQINTLLGSLKNFVTTAQATFFFISGRETLDRYYSEKGSPNSLYESLFDQVFEVPSLLTDEGKHPRGTQLSSLIEEYVCRRISEDTKNYTLNEYYKEIIKKLNTKEDNESPESQGYFYINLLRSFIHFLTFHSWGNPKRLNTIFESFIVPENSIRNKLDRDEIWSPDNKNKAKYWLVFSNSDKRNFTLASEITTLFQHQLSREVSKISDKLTVSVFSSLHFILKLHSYGFSRETLHRMSEAINIYRSPELNTIVDDLLTHVFKPYIRRIRNGMYRFRFHSGFEQELRFISHVSELESASYNFSLNSMRHVKKFFENALVNTDSEETNMISSVHVILGDMSAIEQSYSVAFMHYSVAARILRKALFKDIYAANRQDFTAYVEVLLKQGDLLEHRHNYNRAAVLYSEAENIVREYIEKFQLLDFLQKGDSKWDLLKQPFWASQYLSLKRSPSPFKGDFYYETRMPVRPEHLYRESDSRYYNQAACLYFFRGDAKFAAKIYHTSLKLINQGDQPIFPNERISFLRNYAKVGIVESTLVYQARNFYELYQSSNESSAAKKLQVLLGELLKFAHEQKVLLCEETGNQRIDDLMKAAAEDYENNRLYISTVITCIKTICYFTTILDSFDRNTFSDQSEEQKTLEELLEKITTLITNMGKNAARCIDKARQLESSQGIKTLMVYDLDVTQDNPKDVTELVKLVLTFPPEQNLLTHEAIFWQQSLWTHKLVSVLLWFGFVRNKILGNVSKDEFQENWLPDLSFVSIRSAVLIRWIHARYMFYSFIDKKLINNDSNEECDINKILNSKSALSSFTLSDDSGRKFTEYILEDDGRKNEPPNIFVKAYAISRYLYFAVHQSRIISRKNIDLIFPRLSQIYYIQWKLLTNLMVAILLANRETCKACKAGSGETAKLKSIRDVAFLLQKKFVHHDEKKAPHERIPPSYFDYEYIYLRLEESLDSSINLVDRTSRSHMNIFQHKYFCQDDHNDQEFHMDYVLAYIFTPMALYFRERIKEIHKGLLDLLKKR